jgi:long-chain fatty acid transport protein
MNSRFWLLVVVAALLVSDAAFGSGFSIFEQGAKATAMGGAFAATADDPSAIFYNVAGIAQIRRTELNVGGTAINFANQFTGDPSDPFTAGTTGNYRRHTFVPPNGYVVVPIGTNLTFGVGAFTAFGLRTSWQDPWVGRFFSRDANIKTLSVEPALAWQTSDGRLALGAGAEYRRAHVILNRNSGAFNPFSQRLADVATSYLASEWENAWGWNVGVLFKPGAWRFGASYRAPMTIDFKGNATITQIPSGNAAFDAGVAQQLPRSQGVRTSVDFPSFLAAGIATTMIHGWDIEGDITRTTWSRFKDLTINFVDQPAFSFTREQNWKDTYSYRLGANHAVTPRWDIRLGGVYDQNPQPVEVVSALLPDSDRVGIAFGVGYHAGPWVIDATEFALHFKKRSRSLAPDPRFDNLNGTYHTDANLISLNLGYRF